MANHYELTAKTKRTDKGTVQLTLTLKFGDTVSGVWTDALWSGSAETDTTVDPAKAFAIEKFPLSADSSNPLYRFSHICSVAELLEYPEDDYSDGEDAYFRVKEIIMVFDTSKISDLVLTTIKADLTKLQAEYLRLPNATEVTEVFEIS